MVEETKENKKEKEKETPYDNMNGCGEKCC